MEISVQTPHSLLQLGYSFSGSVLIFYPHLSLRIVVVKIVEWAETWKKKKRNCYFLVISFHLFTDVQRSALGLLFWVIVLTTWTCIFQARRAEWGELGDYLSFTIPLGIP
ncbi:Gamma-secretase subunit PEN-2, partial [Ophiophagus hannah]